MSGLTAFGIVLSLLLHIFDQATDVFAAFLFYVEGHYVAACITLGLVFLPGFLIFVAELKRSFCSARPINFLKAVGYLLLSPLWAVVIHLYSLCDERYVRTAIFFKSLEGFVEAGPQLAFQLSLLLKGGWGNSSQLVIEPILPIVLQQNEEDMTTTLAPDQYYNDELGMENMSLRVFDRVYDKDARYILGCVHVVSVFVSFTSILTTSIVFNDVEDGQTAYYDGTVRSQCCTKKTTGKLIFGGPFFFFTLVFRSLGLALLICFLQLWSGIVLFGLFFINVLTALFVGDDFLRSCAYGIWSFFVPVGYSRDPTSHLGYTKVPMMLDDPQLPPSDKEIARGQARSKYFLTVHVLCSIFLVGGSLVLMLILVFTAQAEFQYQVAFPLTYLINIFLPILGLSLGLSVLLVRPYHRCDWSGGEVPSGNIIV